MGSGVSPVTFQIASAALRAVVHKHGDDAERRGGGARWTGLIQRGSDEYEHYRY